ncbi:unnamed protein product [Coregonus sp. 'balchen']|nr:unnamed protein product [Coregonus sp. 'balchen']
MEHLSRFVGQMSLADDSRAEGNISSEYINIRAQTSIVKKDFGLTTEAGALKENVKRNRYRDILPYDQTRVPLTLLTNENDYDYINASFIKVIIMACREIEMGKVNALLDTSCWSVNILVYCKIDKLYDNFDACVHLTHNILFDVFLQKKCERYWTTFKETTPFGPFIVSNFEESSPNEEVVVRTLTVRYYEETRTISQFQYTAWPDHDIPYTVYGMLGMMDMARKDQGNNANPVLIHCSAGCGRTGVICALDYVHDLLVTKQIKEDFSIMKIVLELRRQRPSAVQTKNALRSAENIYQNLTKVRQKLLLSFNQNSNVQHRLPQPRQQKMNNTYAVVNKSKQLLPPASSTAPPAALHHYDNAELGNPKCHVSAFYSMVKPKSRCPPANPLPAVSTVYDTAGPANHRLAEASAVEDQSGYELVTAERYSLTEDDYEYVSNPIKHMTNICTPGSMEFNCRIKKPKGPRDPPAEWSHMER